MSDALRAELDALTARLGDPAVTSNPAVLARVARRHKEVSELLALSDTAAAHQAAIQDLEQVVAESKDSELVEMAESELPERRAALAKAERELEERQRPRDPADERPAILEIRAGAGGDEATLFAKELYAMYARYAESRGWEVELMSSSASEAGGFKEVICRIAGEGVFGRLKFEAGTHRVQRIPVTESGGRIHTSTVTVAVLPEVAEQELSIDPNELRIDVYRSSGPGGQSVNTTDSAVRITHVPTGLVVSMQDEKSQHKNRVKALSVLRARLEAKQREDAAKERGDSRRAQVGTGDRSEKIRTYNFPQDRITDHRISFTTHGLDKVLAGDLDPLLEALEKAARDADRPAAQ